MPGVELCDFAWLGGIEVLVSHPAHAMDPVTKMNKDELEKWKSFQQRFKVGMGQFESEMCHNALQQLSSETWKM